MWLFLLLTLVLLMLYKDSVCHLVYYSTNLIPNPPPVLTTTTSTSFRHLKPFEPTVKTLSQCSTGLKLFTLLSEYLEPWILVELFHKEFLRNQCYDWLHPSLKSHAVITVCTRNKRRKHPSNTHHTSKERQTPEGCQPLHRDEAS